jgi:hypothetical protein
MVAVGWDFAQAFLADPAVWKVSRASPLVVAGGSLVNVEARLRAGGPAAPSKGEILAHEIGHTFQAMRYRAFYLPIVGAVTIFGEGPRFWNAFENEASAVGQFGGIVPGSLNRALLPWDCPALAMPGS